MNAGMKRMATAGLAAIAIVVVTIASTPGAWAECCQGYCACVDWQTGNEYAGCTITYDKDDNITNVTCGYSGADFQPVDPGQS